MKSPPRFLKPDLKSFDCEIFYSQIRDKEINQIQKALSSTFENALNIVMGGELELIKDAYNQQRNQYNADIVLRHLLEIKKEGTALWIIQKDLYCRDMNFVFGYAIYHKGAVLSTHRLSSQKLKEKESIHEVGHILGLNHCRNRCVMQFSNSLLEAKIKPSYLCENCKRKIMR